MKRIVGAAFVLAACHGGEPWTPAAERDTKDDPAKLRPGHGNEELHVWWPLGDTEITAMRGLDKAKQGDMHALLALALVGSGDHRTPEEHAEMVARVDKFVADLKPTIDAADEWHKGYEINRAMHRMFFGEGSGAQGKGDLGNYSLDQARLTAIFTTSKYNCISSAMLYTVLARAFDLPARGVMLPTHAFVELGPPGGKILEVETTSATGYDWVHDEKFYKEESASWSSKRGLRPGTLEDYKGRTIVEPLGLVAETMLDSRAGDDEIDKKRLTELAVLVAPEEHLAQHNVLVHYVNEANELYDRKAWRTSAKLFDTVGPTIALVARSTKDPEIQQRVAWARWYHANALVVVNRSDEAVAMADEGVKNLDPSWKDYAKLRTNFIWVITDHLLELMNAKDYPAAIKLIQPRFELCKSDAQCSENLAIIYYNMNVEHQHAGDWQAARAALQECVQLLNAPRCSEGLSDLESRHRF